MVINSYRLTKRQAGTLNKEEVDQANKSISLKIN